MDNISLRKFNCAGVFYVHIVKNNSLTLFSEMFYMVILVVYVFKIKAGKMKLFITPDSSIRNLRKKRGVNQSRITSNPIQMEATVPSNLRCQVVAHLVKSLAPADDQDPKS